jgi:hypothetical protein
MTVMHSNSIATVVKHVLLAGSKNPQNKEWKI